MGDYDALRPAERRRLERFAAAFDQVDANDYELFAGTTAPDDEVEAARTTALELIGGGTRRAAVERAMGAFTEAADRSLAGRMPMPQLIFGVSGVSARFEDRVRLLQSLERAVVAVILWDELREAERETLLGPWARVADEALADRG